MTPSLSKEFLLVTACSVWPPSDRRSEAIREAATGPLDWDHFMRLVVRHRVAGLIHDGLTRARPTVPPDIARKIGDQAAALVRQNLTFAAEAVRLQRIFAEANLSVAFVKGIPLALLAYGNLGLRHSRDLDLFVSPESILVAAALLEHAGYRPLEPPSTFDEAQRRMWMLRCKELSFVHDESRLVVELHSRLFDNPRLMPKMVPSNSFRRISLGREIELPTFEENDLFAYLCAHGAVHCWFRLKWLADIGALLSQQPEGGVELLYRAAEARGVDRCAAQAILLCRRLLRIRLQEPLIAELRKNASVRWLETIAMQAITNDLEPTEKPLGTTTNNLAHFLLRGEWHYWLFELENLFINPVDILTLPLRKQFRVLYPLLRLPLWIWRKSHHRNFQE